MVTTFDELLTSDGTPRHPALSECLSSLSAEVLAERQRHAEEELLEKGITFAVYGHNDGNEKIWPFDVVPRPISWDEWASIEAGLKQRIRALNLFAMARALPPARPRLSLWLLHWPLRPTWLMSCFKG